MNSTPAPAETSTGWTRKHLLGLRDLSGAEITMILDQAAEFKRLALAGEIKLNALKGTTVANLFFEPFFFAISSVLLRLIPDIL